MCDGPMVSVCIPTHNRAHLVGRAIRSVLAQSYQHWECIVVDDDSRDHTAVVMRRLADPRLRYIRHDVNRGGSAARNTAFNASSGEYVAFLDSDDEWLPTKLHRQVECFRMTRLKNVGLIYTGCSLVRNGVEAAARPAHHRGSLYQDLLRFNVIGTTSGAMVPRDVLTACGGFDEALSAKQDVDLWLRIARRFQIDCVPDCLVRKHEDRNEPRIGSDWAAKVRATARFYEKYQEDLKNAGIAHHFPYRTGRDYHLQIGDRRAARLWYLKAMKLNPGYLPAYGMWAFSLLPAQLDEKLIQLYKGVRVRST